MRSHSTSHVQHQHERHHESSPSWSPTILHSQYQLLSVIGRGSQSLIYLSYHLKSRKHLAIKRFQEGRYEDALKELSLIQGLRHDNVIRIHEVFVDAVVRCGGYEEENNDECYSGGGTRNSTDRDGLSMHSSGSSEQSWSAGSSRSTTEYSTTSSTLNIVMDYYDFGDLYKWRERYFEEKQTEESMKHQRDTFETVGEGIADVSVKSPHLPESFVLRFLSTMVEVLQYLDKERIIHRDLKPENILVRCKQSPNQKSEDNMTQNTSSSPPSSGYTLDDIDFVVADFGLSTRFSHPDSLKSSLAGSDHCIAPEIKLMKRYSSAVDKFSLGAIMYWLTCGKVSPLYLQLLSEHSHVYTEQIQREILQNYSQSLADIILSLLSVEPDQRPSLDSLSRALKGDIDTRIPAIPTSKYKCAVLGSGHLGRDVAGELARLKCEVHMFDIDKVALQAAHDHIRQRFVRFQETHVLPSENIDWLMNRVILSKTLEEAVRDADVVIEAVAESMDVKRYVFQHLDRHVDPERSIICSNSITWTTDEMGRGVMNPSLLAKSIGLRFLFPVWFFQMVEYTKSDSTNESTVQKTIDFVHYLQKQTYHLPLENKKDFERIFNPSPLHQTQVSRYRKSYCPNDGHCDDKTEYHQLTFLHGHGSWGSSGEI
mmetsp:Transcript_488/g.1829  ORF Transcript_488/g.1829 Transcript_488/m.1829 type:complete len:653 (-) Transcript_488:29-1987(-)